MHWTETTVYDGPTGIAVAMYTIPDEQAYRVYRKDVATDLECITGPLSCEKLSASYDTNASSFDP
jgi:hypothetical protein